MMIRRACSAMAANVSGSLFQGGQLIESFRAQQALWDKIRVVAEPGGAAAFSALLSGKYAPAPDERVAVLVCGANTTAVRFD